MPPRIRAASFLLQLSISATNLMPENPVSLDEFDAVFDVTSEGQDKTMLWTYFQTGARREELFRLQWKDVDFKEKKVRLYWRKNKKGQWRDAWLPVKDELMSLLKAHQKVTGFKTFVFLNFNGSDEPQYWVPYQYRQHWLKNLCEKAGVEKFGFHGIRHLFASTLAAENVPLVEIQYMLRHKNLTTTQRYIHRLKKENREVLEALPDLRNEKKSPLKAHQG
jgi:integrase